MRSVIRSSDWLDEETFYQRAFDAGSRSARIAVNLGDVYTARKEYAKAERLFRSVLDQNPEYPIAQTALATVLYRQGKLQAGQDIYAEIEKKALEARKEYARTWLGAYNLAIVLHNAHQAEEAINVLEKTRNNYPDVWEVAGLESELVRQTQSATAARQIVEQFASRNWWHYGAALALGKLYAQEGNINAAEANLRRASWLDVHDAEALRTLVMIRVRENRLADAAETQRRAIARQPDEPRQYLLLSDILERMGRNEEARAALARADQLRASVQHGVAAN